MNKKDVVQILESIGTILDLKGENPFKSRAYYNAARIIDTLNEDLSQLVEKGALAELKGIGSALAEKITTLVKTGQLPYYENLKTSVPAGLFDLLSIPGLGAKKVKAIHEKLNITTIGELEYACRENRLRELDGFGQKSQEKILQGIELHKQYRERFLFPVAAAEARSLLDYLQQQKQFKRLEVAGSLRRKKETIRDIDIVASCLPKHNQALMEYFIQFENGQQIINQGTTKSTIILKSGMQADLRLVTDDEFPFLLHHSTGSKEHNTAMRALAKTKNLKMNEYGLFKEDKKIACRDEQEIFRALGLQFIPPELREDLGEIEAAQKNALPQLYDGNPFHGIFHMHSNYSDGSNSLAEIAAYCRKQGWQYAGICDHSKSAFYAHGLDEQRVKQQQQEIDDLNSTNKVFRIFKGIEVDILVDGKLDFTDEVLSTFDFVIASVHSHFNMDMDSMTRRICQALQNPYVTMLGHPTGRLLLGREAYPVNMEEVIKTAAQYRKIIEINCNPFRLDLDWRYGKLAKSMGVKTALNPDAHSLEGISDFVYGIGIARKGWFETADILNGYDLQSVQKIFTQIRSQQVR
jgi:DNA polymerase (family 10)